MKLGIEGATISIAEVPIGMQNKDATKKLA
jgi:hypothetical protein